MNNQDSTPARKAVESMLDVLGVVKVVFVDDANNGTVTIDHVIAAASMLDPATLLVAFPELGASVPNDSEVLATRMKQEWNQLDSDLQAKRGQAVVAAARRNDGNETDDMADISILGEIIPEDKLVSLSPEQWESRKDQLLQDSKHTRTLFLFDQDLGRVGGSRNEGINIIVKLLAPGNNTNLMCGLLTHTVAPEDQAQAWVNLSTTHGISRDRFVVIPKLFLSRDPILVAQALKFAALSPDFVELKRTTKDIIAAAAAAAADRVENVSIYDLDHIVFQVPAAEGLWEPDMLFRLHAMFHRSEARRLAHDGGVLEGISARLRSVSGIETGFDLLPAPATAWNLQREELYEFSDHVNRNNLPIEVGDIFERVGGTSTKKYILLAQPCDLMVRGKGKREPELERVPLAEVVEMVNTDDNSYYSEELPYFDASASKIWLVKFRPVHFVRACILDLCVFNQDGMAKLILDKSAPAGIRPTWKKRYDILSRAWDRMISKAAFLAPAANDNSSLKQYKRENSGKLDGMLLNDTPFNGKLTLAANLRSVEYDFRRVARLSRARAIGLLMSYTSTLGRPAYDRDFGRQVGKGNKRPA